MQIKVSGRWPKKPNDAARAKDRPRMSGQLADKHLFAPPELAAGGSRLTFLGSFDIRLQALCKTTMDCTCYIYHNFTFFKRLC